MKDNVLLCSCTAQYVIFGKRIFVCVEQVSDKGFGFIQH